MGKHFEDIHAGLIKTINDSENMDENTQIARCFAFVTDYIGQALDSIEERINRLEGG